VRIGPFAMTSSPEGSLQKSSTPWASLIEARASEEFLKSQSLTVRSALADTIISF
jgi:hypothetical protein